MLRGFEYRHAARHGRAGIFQFRRCVGCAAGFAVVAVLIVRTTLGAGAFDEAVGQEHALFFVVILFNFADVDEAGIAQITVDGLGAFAVFVTVCGVVQIKGDVEAREVTQMLLMHAGDQRFRCDAFLFGAQHDRGAMRVVGTDVRSVVADKLLITHPDIGLDIFDQMTQVDGPVSVGQRGSDEQSTFHGCNFSRLGRSDRGF